jgi:hypothetical protein
MRTGSIFLFTRTVSLANRTTSFLRVASPALPTPPPSCAFVPSPPLHCIALHANRTTSFMLSPPIPIYPHAHHPCLTQSALRFCKSCVHCWHPPGVASAWCFSDPEMMRRQWMASYKAYSLEHKVDSSLSKGFHWIKAKCSELIHHKYRSHLCHFSVFFHSSDPLLFFLVAYT